eukprot:TRINITY_DN18441_c1_g2_i1.p1 TRINITY_DN18441_c1_g2~~TRINITY_DN18441_c1_g2_i1.p1  ORF type:complete len:871 (+),score=224.54 TRINITY_DN18441_c1_g2_i1:75-2615(+)
MPNLNVVAARGAPPRAPDKAHSRAPPRSGQGGGGQSARWLLLVPAAAATAAVVLIGSRSGAESSPAAAPRRGGEQQSAPQPPQRRPRRGVTAGPAFVSAAAAVADCPPPAARGGPPPDEPAPPEPQGVHAAACALQRLSPGLPAAVSLRLQPPPGGDLGDSYFTVEPRDGGGVVITGDTPLALLSGAKLWMRDWLNSSVSWTGARVVVPDPAPAPEQAVHKQRVMKHAYYGNVCTPSYSFWNWGWDRWERELDWMALSGIDLPLVITGQEFVLMRMYLGMGFTRAELDEFFAGPAFLAWHRMGNLQGWAGPLTDSWLEGQRRLTHRIIARAKALGMSPVLPAFHGHVPRATVRLFPNAELNKAPLWFAFKEPYSAQTYVEPTDPLYLQLGRNYTRAQTDEYGATHWYAVDQFNELEPRSRDYFYLQNAAKALWQSISMDNPDAKWIVQGWQFLHKGWPIGDISAYFAPVPYDRLLVLDLMAEKSPLWERTKAFSERQYVWSIMNSFGGTVGLSGNMETAMRDPYKALGHPKLGTHMAGIGLTMEGIAQNTVLYELVLDHVWEPAPRPVAAWTDSWARARYGYLPAAASESWSMLVEAAYRRWGRLGTPKSVYVHRPSLHHRLHDAAQPSHEPCGLARACRKFVSAGGSEPGLRRAETFRHDIVEVCQAVAADVFRSEYKQLRMAWDSRDLPGLLKVESSMKSLLSDTDQLLGASPHYLLGRWIQQALAHAANTEDEVILEHNARNQITLWGPQGEWNDYAAKHWSGLVSSYYAPRWSLFLDVLTAAARRGDWNTHEGDQFWPRCQDFEQRWQRQRKGDFSKEPKGDPLQLAEQLLGRYAPQIDGLC